MDFQRHVNDKEVLMVKHIILWQLKDELSDAEKAKVKQEIREGLEGLVGKVPGLIDVHVYINGLASSNADICLDTTLTDEEALKGYAVHPDHLAVANGKVRPNTKLRVCMDYEIGEDGLEVLPVPAAKKKLVAFFSASGVTKRAAEELAEAAGADLHEIAPKETYTDADLDWTDRSSRCTIEMSNEDARPELAEKTTDLSAYDTVYIGFPIWWGIEPREINTFIENNDLAGKKIAIFVTSGGSGVDGAVKDLQKKYPELNIVGGKRLSGKVTEDII